MGNTRSHSKGCRTCVKRRVKCDERRPSCRRCEKGGFRCGGYRELDFVDAREQVMKKYAHEPKANTSPNTSAIRITKAASRPRDAAMKNGMQFVIRYRPESQPTQSLGDLSVIQNPSPSYDDIVVNFTVVNLCKGRMARAYQEVYPLIPSVRDSQRFLMSQCLLALAKVFFGFQRGEGGVLQDGLRNYGRGVNLLNTALDDKDNHSVTIEIVVSVLSLSIVESTVPNSQSSWMSHILGLERLFALHGPSIFSEYGTEPDRPLLELCRSLMILGAFFTQKPSLMCEPAWKATMQHHTGDEDSNMSETTQATLHLSFMMGLLAELPTLFLQCDECIKLARATSSPPPCPLVAPIRTGVNQLQIELLAWGAEWKFTHHDDVWEGLPATQIKSAQARPWKEVFNFSSTELAVTFAMYHSVVILLTSIPASLHLVGLRGPLPSDTKDPLCLFDRSRQSLLSDIQNSIHSICRSIEYHLDSPKDSQPPADFYLFFPIHVARRACVQLKLSSELAWLTDAFTVMKSSYPTGVWANMYFGGRFSGHQDGLFG